MANDAVLAPIGMRLRMQERQGKADEALRAASRSKRAQILEHISRHPDASRGLRRQARLYRERLEAGMEDTG